MGRRPYLGTASGALDAFSEYVFARDGYGIDDDKKMFFPVTNAIFDGSVAAWQAKREFDYVRPVPAIHYLYTGQLFQS